MSRLVCLSSTTRSRRREQLFAHESREPAASVVVAEEKEGNFTVQLTGTSRGNAKRTASRWKVVDEAAAALNVLLHDKKPVGLVAPDWVRSALERRGYVF